MKTAILGLLAETSIHPGAGSDAGFVDLPVAREAATDYPVIVGSSFKGALLDRARSAGIDETSRNRVFGEQNNAGALLVSDVRLLLLPVRSLTSQYKWITCPYLLERLQRDLLRAGQPDGGIIPAVDKGHYLGIGDAQLYLEERQFLKSSDAGVPKSVLSNLRSLITATTHKSTQDRLEHQLIILHDDDFAWFARYGLAVNARNVLDNEKKTSKNLWYEETIPPDALFFTLLAERGHAALAETQKLFDGSPYIQVGGNETVGQGWLAVTWLDNKSLNGGAA